MSNCCNVHLHLFNALKGNSLSGPKCIRNLWKNLEELSSDKELQTSHEHWTPLVNSWEGIAGTHALRCGNAESWVQSAEDHQRNLYESTMGIWCNRKSICNTEIWYLFPSITQQWDYWFWSFSSLRCLHTSDRIFTRSENKRTCSLVKTQKAASNSSIVVGICLAGQQDPSMWNVRRNSGQFLEWPVSPPLHCRSAGLAFMQTKLSVTNLSVKCNGGLPGVQLLAVEVLFQHLVMWVCIWRSLHAYWNILLNQCNSRSILGCHQCSLLFPTDCDFGAPETACVLSCKHATLTLAVFFNFSCIKDVCLRFLGTQEENGSEWKSNTLQCP